VEGIQFTGVEILTKINDILSPFDWLIGIDGFLNKRIPRRSRTR
jgi:hypothetical protein